jgi:PAS domain S-box-containing protein
VGGTGVSEENTMNDFNRMVPPFKSLLHIADSSNLQRCELVNPQPVGRYKVAELERIERRISEQFSWANEELAQSEERFRDLFDEAPIGYVHEDLDSRFIQANRTAMRLLGVKPEEIAGMSGKSLIPDTPDAQRRLREALEPIRRGTDTRGAVLELRRKDERRPLWVEWWSRPEPGGKYMRTMLIDITDRVLMQQERTRLEAQNAYLLDEIRSEQNFGDIIGKSAAVRKVMKQIQQVAPTEATVLITGESGTGKELVARAIHEHSTRNGRALIRLNCSAVPESLFESEFFGHARGSFTGALKDKPGRFEMADGGTLFLDEIGEVPLAMQAKLLRVLQEQELERIGDTHTRKVNVRVIAASNRDLTREVDEGRFRQDLYYRLWVFPIEVPPLRERREDIAPLAAHFIKQSAKRMNRPEPTITEAALAQLASYDWPGNIRQLQNVIERSIILWQEGPLIFDLPASRTNGSSAEVARAPAQQALVTREELKRQEREAIAAAIRQTNGKVSGPGGAAELLGIKPTTLASRIAALGINRRAVN